MHKMKKYIGDKSFYKQVFSLIIPIMIQQLFISIAGYVDNIMINNYGNNAFAYNGVNAANKIMYVCNFVFMGVAATASIFIAQYYGAKKKEKIHEAFRLGIYCSFVFGVIATILIILFGNRIVDSYLQSEISRNFGYDYLKYMSFGIIITSINIMIANSFRSVKSPNLALISSAIGIVINVGLNYILIFGNFGFKEMGAGGAALATVISRVVEFLINIIFLVFMKESYFKGSFNKLKVSKSLVINSIKKGLPLIINELLWSMGMVLLAKFYTYNNEVWYSSYGYAQNISDLFFICFAGLGTSTAVVIGTSLGRSEFDQAEKDFYHFRGLAIMMGISLGVLMIFLSPLIITMFNPSEEIKNMSISILRVSGIFTAIYCYTSVSFFTLRAGGDSLRAFILDQSPTYLICLPVAVLLGINAEVLGLSIVHIFLASHIGDLVKVIIGNYFIKQKKWLKNLTLDKKDDMILEFE